MGGDLNPDDFYMTREQLHIEYKKKLNKMLCCFLLDVGNTKGLENWQDCEIFIHQWIEKNIAVEPNEQWKPIRKPKTNG